MFKSNGKIILCIVTLVLIVAIVCTVDVRRQNDSNVVTEEVTLITIEPTFEAVEYDNSIEEEIIESPVSDELIEYSDGERYLSIVIPNEWKWEYNIRTSQDLQMEDGLVICAIDFWNEDYPDDVFQLGYMSESLGMCATGVTIEHYMMENGISGTSYIEKDDEKVWLTITLYNPYNNLQGGTYFVSGSPAISDWDNIETEFYQILSTAWVGKRDSEIGIVEY